MDTLGNRDGANSNKGMGSRLEIMPAGYLEIGAGNEIGRRRGEKEHRVGDVTRTARVAQRRCGHRLGNRFRLIGVARHGNQPGDTALTVTPCGPSSWARFLVSPTMAALAEA